MKEIKIITKDERNKFPHLKTKTELKKMKLMPKPRVKPRAIYKYYTPYSGKAEYTNLYDETLTCTYKPTKEELKARQKRDKERRARKRLEKEREKKLQRLKETIQPHQIVVFDVETTGIDTNSDEILQFSAINGEGEVLLNTYVRPEKHTTWYEAQSINGISPEMVKDKPTMRELWEQIQSIFLSANLLIAYNGYFDMEFLIREGIEIPKVDYYDVMFAFAPIYGEYDEYHHNYRWQKLAVCASHYGYSFDAHDSLEDVKATLYCYKQIEKEKIRKVEAASD